MGKVCTSKYNGVMICRHLIIETGKQSVLYILATWNDAGLLR
jgi:hypothetical protein